MDPLPYLMSINQKRRGQTRQTKKGAGLKKKHEAREGMGLEFNP